MSDTLILVDAEDREIGYCEKQETHVKGLLHRAFSIFIFNGDTLLMQRRASGKYHSPGKWANSCCSHPRQGESLEKAAVRRLEEETGICDCTLREAGSFIYRAEFDNGLTEYEYDHVFIGEYGGDFTMNPEEADEMKFLPLDSIMENMRINPEAFTTWFITALPVALTGRER